MRLRAFLRWTVRIGVLGAALATLTQSEAVSPSAQRQPASSLSGTALHPADPGAALLLAEHALATNGSSPDQQRAVVRAIATYASDPLAQAAVDQIVLEPQPDDLPTLRNLITLDLQLHNWRAVVPYVAHVSLLDPGDATSRFQLSMLLLPAHLTDAEAQLSALISDPDVGNLAQSALQSLKTQPLTLAIRAVGLQLASASQWPLASYLLQQSVVANPQDSQAIALLGVADEAQGQEGWSLIQQAAMLSPGDPLIQYAVALHWQHIGDNATALAALLQAQKAAQGSTAQQAALSAAIGNAYLQNGALDQAAQAFQQAISLAPRNPGFSETMAAFYADEGYRPAEALPFIQTAIAQFPNDARLYASLGQVLLDSGQGDEALKAARQATALAPDSAQAQLVLGRCLEQSGDQVGAQTAYQAALRSTDSTGVAYRALAGKALVRLGYRPG